MGSQAVVTLVDPDGVVLLKVVIGSGGEEARDLAQYLADTGDIDPRSVYDEAKRLGLSSVLVLGRDEHYCSPGETPSARAVDTFGVPAHHPDTVFGECDRVWVVEQGEGGGVFSAILLRAPFEEGE